MRNTHTKVVQFHAWILDLNVHHQYMELWLKTPGKKVVRAYDRFKPSIYAVHDQHKRWQKQGRVEEAYDRLCYQLNQQEGVYTAQLCWRRVHAEEALS